MATRESSVTKLSFALISLAALTWASAAMASGASSTRPPSGSSGGSVSRPGSSSSSSSGSSHSSSSRSDSSHSSSNDGRTPVSGQSTWRNGHGGGHSGHGSWSGGWGWGGWYDPWYPRFGPWGIGWWGYGYGYPYYYDAAPYAYTRSYPNDDYGPYGALDTDVSPERAQVWVNGKLLGVADDFDGFPTYLWLKQGVYDVVFYLDGYETIARQYVIRPGQIIGVEDDMVEGQAIKPQDLQSKSHVRRDERLEQDREAEQDAARGIRPGYPAPPDQSWRENGRMQPPAADGRVPSHEVSEDARLAPSRLRLEVEPGDASVYLDGRFIGTGAEIAQLSKGLLVDAGAHRIEAVRPGRKPVTKEFTAAPGEETSVDLSLDEP